jgi:hypothetical protein
MSQDSSKSNQLEKAFLAAQNGSIESWVHDFLLSEGKNTLLSAGLKKEKRYWLGPLQVSLSRLDRVVGPEEGKEYHSVVENWEAKTDGMQESITSGWSPAPLIAEYRSGVLSLRDGNHRMKALEKAGVESYWTLICFNSKEDLDAGSEEFK